MSKVLKDTVPMVEQIKAAIKGTTLMTPDFIQRVIADAGIERAKSCKSPAKLVELWNKRELTPGSLRLHVKRVAAGAPQRVQEARKPVKATKGSGKRGRPRKSLLMIESDQRMLPLQIAA